MPLQNTKPSKAKAAKGPRTVIKASKASAKLPTKRRAQFRPTNDQSLAAAALTTLVFDIKWKDRGEQSRHLENLRKKDHRGWMAATNGTTYPTIKMIFSEERWRDARNVASLPSAYRPAVFQPTEDKKVRYERKRERCENGESCSLCTKPCGSYTLERK
jgi:hypothetical protein